MTDNWNQWFVDMAAFVSTKSKDPKTKVGAIVADPKTRVVLSMGYNGLPRNLEDKPERMERPDKYLWTEHAERNAIYNAARHGIKLEGAWLYLNYRPFPCSDCARAIIQSGIVCIVGPDIQFSPSNPAQWKADLDFASEMLNEVGIHRFLTSSQNLTQLRG